MHWIEYWRTLRIIGGRYFFIAGLAFLIFYIIFHRRVFHKKIQPKDPKMRDYAREIVYSILTICIFAAVPILILKNPSISPHTKYYTDINTHGWPYFFLAFPIMFFLHDTYFYWTHRIMHHKKIFPFFHLVHHHSINPSPWAAYSFHPLEAVVEAGIFAVFLFTIPIHQLHLYFFFLAMLLYNVYGHLGYELYPKGFSRHWLGRWINTSVNHNLHHQYFKGNYGLYFTFWDRMMGTIRSDYDRRFEEVKSRRT